MHWEKGKAREENLAGNHSEIPTVPDPTPHTLRRMVRQEKAIRQNATIAARPVIGRGIARILHYAIDASRPDISPTNVPWKIKGRREERARRKEDTEGRGSTKSMPINLPINLRQLQLNQMES